MPIYDYKCHSCSHDFSVAKRMADIDNIEACPTCQTSCDRTCRLITTAKEFFGEKPEEPFYSIPLGKWVKGKTDMRRQAKERGLIEVGNENIDKLIDKSNRERDKRSSDRWNDLINPSYEVRA